MKSKEKEWIIKLYKTPNGRCPVKIFMKTLNQKDKENMTKQIMYLKEVGKALSMPHGRKLRNDIYELRITLANNNTRTLYFFCYDTHIVLTHTFIKKQNKIIFPSLHLQI
jgi:phage-related protein